MREKKGQSILEMTVSMTAVIILLFGTVKMFLWFNQNLLQRQHAYEQSRVAAANSTGLVAVDQSELEPMDIFGENQ